VHNTIQNILAEDPSAAEAIADHWLYVALCRRDSAEAARAVASVSAEGIIPFSVRMPRSFCEGLAARARNDVAAAKTAFEATHLEVKKILGDQPDYAQAFCVLGMVDAALGRKKA